MKKNKFFCFSLIIIYILFLSKDTLWGLFNKNDININTDTYYKNEYEDMRKLLDIEPVNYEVVYSKVILRDIYEFYNKLTINKGSNKGIREGDLVINQDGVIGKIDKVYKNYSEVVLLTSNKINLSVKINDAYGILKSSDEEINVLNIKLNEEIKEGDYVYTSGLTNSPRGILIGEVKEINKDDLELEYKLVIEPKVNLKEIKYVGVINNDSIN